MFANGGHERERAILARMDPAAAAPATVVTLAGLLQNCCPDQAIPTRDMMPRWQLVVHCLALVHGRHNVAVRTGEALAGIWYSEARLGQLLNGTYEELTLLLPRLARLLDQRQLMVNWCPLGELALYAGADERRAAVARAQLSRSFATGQFKQEG